MWLVAAIVQHEDTLKDSWAFVGAWFFASLLGLPMSWTAGMFVGFAPPEVGITLFFIRPLA
jgi:uncharacterized membrane protein YgaE (UPF0421/DUF939 family)